MGELVKFFNFYNTLINHRAAQSRDVCVVVLTPAIKSTKLQRPQKIDELFAMQVLFHIQNFAGRDVCVTDQVYVLQVSTSGIKISTNTYCTKISVDCNLRPQAV